VPINGPPDRLPTVTLLSLAVSAALAGGCGGGAAGPPDPGPLDAGPVADAQVDVEIEVDMEIDGSPPHPAPDAGVDGPASYPRPQYRVLAETGFFAAGAGGAPAPDLLGFEPAYRLWSDGTSKRRWVRLPPGTRIDTSEMDHWQFPVGTKVWKEFSREGVLLETRLVERYGTGREDYWMGAFVWNADGSEAVYREDGAADVNGSSHDVPAAKVCGACHRGDKGRVLGLSALQLGQPASGEMSDMTDPGLTLGRLVEMGLLTAPPPAGTSYAVPGDGPTAAALGYLHANCGHCHNENGTSWPDTQMVLRLRVSERSPAGSELYQSVVGARLQSWRHPTLTQRVVAGDPDQSGLLARMKIRGSKDQMPSLATEIIDSAGVEAVTRWIADLPP
jgi:cytochrome c553